MTGMEEVLAAHVATTHNISGNIDGGHQSRRCQCGSEVTAHYSEMSDDADDLRLYLNAKFAAHVAEALTAAGYRKPRQINNYSELAALPYGSAVLTSDISDTVVLRSDRDDFMNQSGYTIPARTLWDYGSKPFTVLYEPLP